MMNDDLLDALEDFDEEEQEDDEDGSCWTCRGTGEGMMDGASCSSCNGKGYVCR